MSRARIVILFTALEFLVTNAARGQQPAHRPKIGVALEGGGAKGLAHIDVLRWFEEHHVPIDYIAGTSMGGLVAGLYATGHSPADIQRIVEQVDWDQVLAGTTPYPDLAFRRKEDLRAFPNGLEIGLRHGVQPPGGLNSGQPVRMIIDRYVLPYSQNRSFDTLPVPFRCVATDLVSGKPVVFKDGSLANALRATMSIPGVFAPIPMKGAVLADGGLLDNLPTDVVKEMGADIVIGVHLSTGTVTPQNLTSMFQVAGGSMDVMIDANVLHGMELADIVLTINVQGFSTLGFERSREIIPKGYEAAQAKANVLKAFSLSDEDWSQYLAQRDSRRITTVPVPQFVEVKGTSPQLASGIQERLSSFADKPIDTSALQKGITREMGIGLFNSLSYSLTDQQGENGLLITADEKDYLPPWLKPGFVIDGSDPNNVQFEFGGRITSIGIGGYRSELRTDFSIGSTYSLTTEYYHPFSATSRWFIAPQIGASRSPLNVYYKNDFIAEYKENNVEGQFDLGYQFNRFSQLQFGYQAGYLSANRYVGIRLLPNVSGRTGVTGAVYALDLLDNPVVPRNGIALLANGGWHDANAAAKGAFPSGELTLEAFRKVSNPGSIYAIGAGGTTFGYENVGFPLFALGGPPRLAAYGVNEFLTNKYLYGRLGYLHRLTYLPPFLGNAIYVDGHVEAANTYLPHAGVPGDVVAGFIMETILGPILIGGSVGESGHQKWFFQLGRIF
jgi:NTE family protein